MSPNDRVSAAGTARTDEAGGLPALALPGLREVYAAHVCESAELPGLPDALAAEVWVSARLGRLQAAAPHRDGHRRALTDLVRVMAHAGTPGALVFLRAFAALGPHALRPAAARAADALRAVGTPEPEWAARLGDVVPGDVVSIQDGSLDRDRLVCEFRYRDGTGRHALAVLLEQGLPTQLVAVGDVDGMMAAVRKAAEAEQCVVVRLDRAAAAARLGEAFTRIGSPPRGDDEWFALLPFAQHRVEALNAPILT